MAAISRFSLLGVAAASLLLAGVAQAQPLSLITPPATAPSYYQCMMKINDSRADPAYQDIYGHLGLFQFSVQDARDAGLCSNVIPVSGERQIWSLCDFKGPLATQYQITSERDLLRGPNAVKAQFAMLEALTKVYDDYIYKQRYDLQFDRMIGGIIVGREALHAMLMAYGKVATDEFMRGKRVERADGTTPYSISTCVQLCVDTKAKYWNCELR